MTASGKLSTDLKEEWFKEKLKIILDLTLKVFTIPFSIIGIAARLIRKLAFALQTLYSNAILININQQFRLY